MSVSYTHLKLVGLIYPDSDDAFAHGLNQSALVRVMEENRLEPVSYTHLCKKTYSELRPES